MIDNEILDNYEPASCFDKVKTRGRPKMKLNAVGIRVIEALASVQCTHDEIAACLHTTKDTLYAKHNLEAFSTAYEKGQELGKLSLRRYQFRLAAGNPTMAIFLGKQYLGQSETKKEDGSAKKDALDQLCAAIRAAGGDNGKQ